MNRNYIAGEWLDPDHAIENRSPSDVSDLIGTCARTTNDQLERALDSAHAAQKLWRATGLETRQAALMKIGATLVDRADALVVMDDADIDLAVACAVNGAFGGAGQKCTASSRLIVHDVVHDNFVEKFVAETTKLDVGHAFEDGAQTGPAVSADQLAENLDYVALARQEGGEVLCGGERLELAHDGHYMAPCVAAGTGNDWRINREEMFPPIACVIRAGSCEEAPALSNDTGFGLTAGIMTTSLARAGDFRRRAETGVVMVNLPTAGTDCHVPFGGRGDSSYGPREQGQYAVEFFTGTKTAYIAAGAPS